MQNMKSVENTRRELFEAWVKSQEKLNMPLHRFANLPIVYSDPITATAWLAFNAALDSVVIELPQAISEFNTNSDGYVNPVAVEYDECIQDCRDAIESTNLGIKVK